MPEGVVQRRGVPQAEAVADRFGQQSLGAPTELFRGILPVAKVARVDLPSIGGIGVGGLAANRTMVQLFNPSGSNTDLMLKRIWVSSNTTGTLLLRTHDTALTTNQASKASMLRQEGTNQVQPIGQIRSVQGSAVGTSISFYKVIADTTFALEFRVGDGEHFDGFVIQPGRGILMLPDADDRSLTIVYQWLERQVA